MYTYPLQQDKNKHKGLLKQLQLFYVYSHSTTTKNINKSIDANIPSIKCVHTLHNNTNINTKTHLPKRPVLHVYIPSTTEQT